MLEESGCVWVVWVVLERRRDVDACVCNGVRGQGERECVCVRKGGGWLRVRVRAYMQGECHSPLCGSRRERTHG